MRLQQHNSHIATWCEEDHQGHVFHCFFKHPLSMVFMAIVILSSLLQDDCNTISRAQKLPRTAWKIGGSSFPARDTTAWYRTCPEKASAGPGWTLDEQMATATPKDWYSNLTNFQLLRTSHRWRPETIQLLAPWAPSAIAWPCNALEGCQYLSPWSTFLWPIWFLGQFTGNTALLPPNIDFPVTTFP